MTKDELSAAAAKTTPPAALVGWSWLTNLTLNDWVAIATLAYIGLQAFVLVRKEFVKRRK